ncbi:hypothetical protein TCAL_06161 [Tigriopus californicus]|uniref:Protein-serine/threonine phosphatase n=1 Tax=Tigriopus californicus TaxID=6832 RepID=A0A553PJM0_TIGCA|nr:dual specificity phosphatase 29-like [Tigriopus californicus]TRY77887.1 hypothetical protein TCAL_06161 [Tigriopus californicus]|eukprot:TCALIF_06161-PA protein Name:"Similar to dupd1 Dual specificity phosphatase DUPD1 (Tetraodon nigroviridis)" AED:0.18 eAED:0.18 QI:0/-1/0/1/-1/1/1/0/298
MYYSNVPSYPSALTGRFDSPSVPRMYNFGSDYSTAPSKRFSDAFNSTKYNFYDSSYKFPSRTRASSVGPPSLRYRDVINPIRAKINTAFSDEKPFESKVYYTRAPSLVKETTRDDLIDSILHTRTSENRRMPGFFTATNWEERNYANVDCDKVHPGIYLANAETVKNIDYLKSIGATHVLNTAEGHVKVNPGMYPLHNINYYGFHVDDHPNANISRFFTRTNNFIEEALNRNGIVVVNCVMGWSRSATVVAAYLVAKKGMTANQAVEQIRRSRPIRPNPGFLNQLSDFDNIFKKRLVW